MEHIKKFLKKGARKVTKILCKWVFLKDASMIAKQKDVSNMNAQEVLDMITTLLAQSETVRLIFEKEKKK